jgi:hypothetical protein
LIHKRGNLLQRMKMTIHLKKNGKNISPQRHCLKDYVCN